MKYLLAILIFCFSLTLFADNKLAIINDADGYTNVRQGPGTNFKIVDTLLTGDFFYFEPEDKGGWAKITAWKGRQIEGFVHKSKIQEVEKLAINKQKELFTNVLDRQKMLANNYQKAWQTGDSISYRKTLKELEFHSEAKYEAVLNVLPKYFCSTGDSEVLQLLFETIWADKSSASETPSFSIGQSYICRSNLVNEQISTLNETEQKKQIFEQIEWGLLNHFEIEDPVKSTNEEFNKLKAILDSGRKKAGL